MNEATLLRSIAETDDDVRRLVLADWLEEQGDSSRADFIRVQCELAGQINSTERRQALRERERQLLDTHWQEWLRQVGLPMEDVGFRGGLIVRMRLTQWQGGKLLGPECAPRLATLEELDLSRLAINDAGLTAFAESAQFPALRKLILCDNDITPTGVAILADAAGVPKLDTVYLFRNPVGPAAHELLEIAGHYCLGNLDLGQRADGYSMSPGEAEVGRREYIRTHLLPVVARYFKTYPLLRSAMLCVAQYWNDEAGDAVHGELILSELLEPTIEAVPAYGTEPDANTPNTRIERRYGRSGSAIALWEIEAGWEDNDGAIPLWAAYAPEGGNQDFEYLSDVYAPAVLFYRHGGYDLLPIRRPHLDGIRTEWDERLSRQG